MSPSPPSVVELVTRGAFDTELASQLWLLLEGGTPVVVAGDASVRARLDVRSALEALGPQQPSPRAPAIVDDLSAGIGDGEPFRAALHAAGRGRGFLTSLRAGSLEHTFDLLRHRPFRLTDDELSALGVVLVLRADADSSPESVRVAAAHYVRPIARDGHGHIQRLPPAVLATHDHGRDVFEHFAWGIVPELAFRVGRRPGDYQAELERRTAFLGGLAHAKLTADREVRRAIASYAIAPAAAIT